VVMFERRRGHDFIVNKLVPHDSMRASSESLNERIACTSRAPLQEILDTSNV
jgi:hypothetical protein